MNNDIFYLNYHTREEEVLDCAIHSKEQDLNINVIRCYQAFKEQWKAVYGSNRDKYGHEYYKAELGKHLWSMEKVWDVVDCNTKIKYINDILGKEPIQIIYEKK